MSTNVESIILEKLNRLEEKIDAISVNGCSKVESHRELIMNQREIYNRLNIIERAQSEGRGKLSIVMLIAGGAMSLFFIWLGKRIG